MSTRTLSVFFFIPLFCLATATQAAVFNVTTRAEFQAALTTAETNGENDTINVAAGTYSSTASLNYTLSGTEDNKTLLIQGAGAGTTIIDFLGGSSLSIRVNLADDSNAHVTIRGLTIQNGNACSGGGLTLTSSGAALTADNNIFLNNAACDGDGGGAEVRTNTGTITLRNNVFKGNSHETSGDDGGGAYVQTNSGVINVINNTFIGNTVDNGNGDGLAVRLLENTAVANIYNNIIRGNGTEDIHVNSDGFFDGVGSPVNLFNNDFSTSTITDTDNFSQGNNINQDPLLDASFHLLAGSPAIGTGLNAAPALPATDFDGNARIMGAIVDIGADEYLMGAPVAPPVSPIPMLSRWTLLVLILLLAGLGYRHGIYRKQY